MTERFLVKVNMKAMIKEGEKYFHWTVIAPANKRNGREMVLCQCDCGTLKEVRYDGIKCGSSKSCGCARGTHKMTSSRLYNIWHKMKERCYNKNHVHYKNYGGRGITVCEEWKNDFISFYKWSMDNGYSENLTLDRVNGNSNYSPENCRWTTPLEQQNNTRNNRILTVNGRSQSIARWSAEMSIPYSTIYSRLCNGWNEQDAVMYPVDKSKSSNRRLYANI